MKKQLTIIVVALTLSFNGCASFPLGSSSATYKQAFGDAIRSLEGRITADEVNKVPAMIEALAAKWLPKSGYSTFVQGIIKSYLAAHPMTQDQVNKVLEGLATMVQSL